MARYFIDTSDGDLPQLDDEGIDLADQDVARKAALEALPDLARDVIPDGDTRRFVVRVRDGGGKTLYCATLTLAGAWCEDGVDPVTDEFAENRNT